MIKTNNNSIQFRNYNRKSRNRPSSLILTVSKNNNIVELKTGNNDTVIIPRRYSENSLNSVSQNNDFFSDIGEENHHHELDIKSPLIKKDQSSQTSLELENDTPHLRDKCTTGTSIKDNKNVVRVKKRSRNSLKQSRGTHDKRHSDHVPHDLHHSIPQYEEDTAISVNNILDAINDTMINTDSYSDDEFETLVQNYNSNPYYYVKTQNKSLFDSKTSNVRNNENKASSPKNYPLVKSKSDNTILNNDNINSCTHFKSKDDIHIAPENIHIKEIDHNNRNNSKESSVDPFYNPFDIFKNNSAPLNLENGYFCHKFSKDYSSSKISNKIDQQLGEHGYKHKVKQKTKVNSQINTNQSPIGENKAFLINNNNYMDNEVKVNEYQPEGSKYYCRMLPGDTRTLPKSSALGSRLSVFRKSKTLTSKKVSYSLFIIFIQHIQHTFEQ